MGPGLGLNSLRAPVSMQESIDRFDVPRCRTGRTALAWVETVGAGACCQKASVEGSGGVSTVIGSSDLDVHSFGRLEHIRNRCTCSLLFSGKSPTFETLCLFPLTIRRLFDPWQFLSLPVLAREHQSARVGRTPMPRNHPLLELAINKV